MVLGRPKMGRAHKVEGKLRLKRLERKVEGRIRLSPRQQEAFYSVWQGFKGLAWHCGDPV